ncbi:hypothetical protein C8Q74DRAFT_329471 [Fomes fomentarius]|nr:hypothetical protein C8Q74DRAFT_329471 [Fomes fomentarius]
MITLSTIRTYPLTAANAHVRNDTYPHTLVSATSIKSTTWCARRPTSCRHSSPTTLTSDTPGRPPSQTRSSLCTPWRSQYRAAPQQQLPVHLWPARQPPRRTSSCRASRARTVRWRA